MASPGILDANALVDLFLDQEVHIRRTWRGHQLLRVRENVSKREIDIIYRRMVGLMRPDKHHFNDWVMTNYPDTLPGTMEECKGLMRDFWAQWLQTKNSLQELDEGKYKQASMSQIANLSQHGQACIPPTHVPIMPLAGHP